MLPASYDNLLNEAFLCQPFDNISFRILNHIAQYGKTVCHYIRIQGNTMGSREDFARLLRFVEHADLHPPIDAVYAAADARAAFGRVIAGDVFGKVALTFA